MIILETLDNITSDQQGCVIAIGNFDGVHRGHQILLEKAKEIADRDSKSFAVLTFEPHPRELMRPDEPPSRITPLALKARRLQESGVDILYALTFDWDFASQTAEDFVAHILQEHLKAHHIVVGYDFCFGQLRKGNPQTIQEAGLATTIIEKIACADNEAFSSSRIRQALRRGHMEIANDLLGWEWEMQGSIERGDRRGHELGYPTANVPLGNTLHPSYGIYASRVQIEGENIWRPAATNIGIRPMFEVEKGLIEAHILDFEDTDIYGKNLRVKPVKRLRGEAKFHDIEALIQQMEKDCQATRDALEC